MSKKMNESQFKNWYRVSNGMRTQFDDMGLNLEPCNCNIKNCKGWLVSFNR